MRISLDHKGRLIFMHRHYNYSPNAFKSAMFQKYFLWSLATNALKAQLSISLGVKRKTRIQCCSGMDMGIRGLPQRLRSDLDMLQQKSRKTRRVP
jgi:hypothetical protein